MLDIVNKQSPAGRYDASAHRVLSFHAARLVSPTALTRRVRIASVVLSAIEALELAVMAFAFLYLERATAADEATARYKAGTVDRFARRYAGRHQDGLSTLSSPVPEPIGMDQGRQFFNEAGAERGR